MNWFHGARVKTPVLRCQSYMELRGSLRFDLVGPHAPQPILHTVCCYCRFQVIDGLALCALYIPFHPAQLFFIYPF